ncbi:MAG TPA: DUF4149 domain-containing protein [Persephonella sp.]|nr:DUF4149 domain-containing protein [Persephonella sp.]
MLSKIIDLLILFILGVLAGFNIFLTFIVAPVLFSNLDNRHAGEIMNLIFPYYFSSGWILGIAVYSLFALKTVKNKEIIKKFKLFVVALGLLIILNMALHKTVLPIARSLNIQYYTLLKEDKKEEAKIVKDKFKKVHAVSSSINLINLILEIYLFQHFLLKIRKKED